MFFQKGICIFILAIVAVSIGCFQPTGSDPVAATVQIVQQNGKWTLLRNGEPYYIKGIGGNTRLDEAAALGANSLRTWGSEHAASDLDNAQANDLTVMLGVWLSHDASHYNDERYKNEKRAEVQNLLDTYKDHPALLLWSLGNEINQSVGTTESWEFVNELARMIRDEDPNHPISTVISGPSVSDINQIVQHAPLIDILGVNSYGGIGGARMNIDNSDWEGAYIVSEWGPQGHWEVNNTSWGRPIEQTSDEKATVYKNRYEMHIAGNKDRCIGSYVFLWGQKQERTPTWYGLFIENKPELGFNGEKLPTYDVMSYLWSGDWPGNRAPVVTAITLNNLAPTSNVELAPDTKYEAALTAEKTNGEPLSFRWELLIEPTRLGSGGSFEPRPNRIGDVIESSAATIDIRTPSDPGEYRLFGYAFDSNGKVGTANIPFRIITNSE